MALNVGTRIANYEITGTLGAGGMGEVYRARDVDLGRDVAIKVLPDSLVADAERVARFEREARTLAALNHPNIAQIFGIQRSDDDVALIMELVDGPTLADRIAEAPLDLDEALPIAIQITDALEAAHERGIVHRDLKPANIKLRPDGTVKVLDFGIAKAFEPQTLASGSGSPILTTPATQAGVILGTAAYMSPEQARGKNVDTRTDVWAFGCVLYEMLTGQLAFGGEDVATTLARIIANETDMGSLPDSLPQNVRRTLQLCLAKDLRKRVADIRDVRLALEGAFQTDAPALETAGDLRQPAWRRALPPAAAALLAAAAVALVSYGLRPDAAEVRLTRFVDTLPEDRTLQDARASLIDIAADGRFYVYTTTDGFMYRALDEFAARPIVGPDFSVASAVPTLSPDGRSLVYFDADGRIQRVPVAGGAPIVLTGAVDVRLAPIATWRGDGTLLYNDAGGIHRLAATGGAPEQVIAAQPPGEVLYGPQLLPDGDSLLFSVLSFDQENPGQVVVESLSSGERKTLVSAGGAARYLPSGHLVYASGNTLFAVAFDVQTLSVSGAAVPVVQGMLRNTGNIEYLAQYAVAANGTLVYITDSGVAAPGRQLVWVDRDGREEPTGLGGRDFRYVQVSPDGRRLATSVSDGGDTSLWVSDVARPVLSLVTGEIASPWSFTWSVDGRRLIFPLEQRSGDGRLGWTLADGTGTVEPIVQMEGHRFVSPGGRTPDGSAIVYTYGAGSVRPSIGLLSLEADGSGQREWRPLIERATGASTASVSPNGEWVAYHTDDTGQYAVYIERFPAMSGRQVVSDAAGGWGARWSPDGSELYYRRLGDGAMMAVSLSSTPSLTIGTPEVLFDGRAYIPSRTPEAGGNSGMTWDLAGDGRFLMIRAIQQGVADEQQIVVVQNWFEELNRLVPVE